MTDVVDDVTLSPKQARSILEADARVNVWHGSVSSGKTIASIIAWLLFVMKAPPGRLVMIGRTKDTLYRNVLGPAMEMFGSVACPISYTKGANTATIFGREVDVLGANDVGAESRIRGMTCAGAYVDEGSLLPGEGYWQQLLNRLRVEGARLFLTTNPDNPTHWLKKVIDRAAELGYHVWHFILEDNPGLPTWYVEQIKRENTGLWYLRNILGKWVLAEGAIYDMFDPTPAGRHVVSVLPQHLEDWTLAIDYGTTNPFVALLMAVDPVNDRLVIAREWRWDSKAKRRQLTDGEYSRHLRAWLADLPAEVGQPVRVERVAVDPSAASFLRQLYLDDWQGVMGADNSVGDGIRSVATLLACDRLVIHESCKGLIDEKVGYVWDPKAAEKGEDKPVKVADHGPDAERYGVAAMRRFWRHWVASAEAA